MHHPTSKKEDNMDGEKSQAEELVAYKERMRLLIYGAVHDLCNTLMQSTCACTEIRLLGVSSDILSHLDDIEFGIRVGVEDIRDLTTQLDIDTGRLIIDKSSFDLGSLIDRTVRKYRTISRRKRIPVIPMIPRELPMLFGDRVMIGRILNNLVGNALKFTNKGEIRIIVGYSEKDSLCTLLIKDSGIGIDEAQIGQIFEAFKRGNNNGVKLTGLGLGLSIVKTLVQSMNGSIEVQSEPNQGTTFTVKMPLEVSHVQ